MGGLGSDAHKRTTEGIHVQEELDRKRVSRPVDETGGKHVPSRKCTVPYVVNDVATAATGDVRRGLISCE